MNSLLSLLLAFAGPRALGQEPSPPPQPPAQERLGAVGTVAPSAERTRKAQAAAAAEQARIEAGRQGLEGTRWRMRLVALGFIPRFWASDELSFQGGMFSSSAALPLGFTPSIYEARPSADGFAWLSAQQNPRGERTEWKGARAGRRMSGTLTWTQPDGKARTYRWKARQIERKE